MVNSIYYLLAAGIILCGAMEFCGSHYQYRMAMLTLYSGGIRVKRKKAKILERMPLWNQILLLSLFRKCRQDRGAAAWLLAGNTLSLLGFLACAVLGILTAAWGKGGFTFPAAGIILGMVVITTLICALLDVGGKSKRYALETPLEILAMLGSWALMALVNHLEL